MKSKQFKFSIISIEELEFTMFAQKAIDDKGKALSSFSISINETYNWNIEKDLIGVIVEILYERPDNGTKVLSYKPRINYKVEKLKDYLDIRSPNDFDMDENLETTLISIAISTIRGTLYGKTRGTVFHNHLLPLIDPKKHLLSKLLKK